MNKHAQQRGTIETLSTEDKTLMTPIEDTQYRKDLSTKVAVHCITPEGDGETLKRGNGIGSSSKVENSTKVSHEEHNKTLHGDCKNQLIEIWASIIRLQQTNNTACVIPDTVIPQLCLPRGGLENV